MVWAIQSCMWVPKLDVMAFMEQHLHPKNYQSHSEEKRPAVQVGDPFMEKLLLEACLELIQNDALVGIQDMGAAGLTSSSAEMASKAGIRN